MALVAVAPTKFMRGFDGRGREHRDAYQVLELREALLREYPTDAHLVTYVTESARRAGGERQCRINKPGLAYYPEPVAVDVLFADVDNPGHAPWTPALIEQARSQWDRLDVLQTAGVYYTANGRRYVQPLAEPIPVQKVEPYMMAFLHELADAGLDVDFACRDWTRHYRPPHVRRKGRPFRSPVVWLDRMQPIRIEPAVTASSCHRRVGAPGAHRASSRPAPPSPRIEWSASVPSVWKDRSRILANAIREVESEWHTLFLALSGALLARGVPGEILPALIETISVNTSADTRTRDRVAGARTTAEARAAGRKVTGYGSLRKQWPAVADALDRVTARGLEGKLREQAAGAPSAAEMTAADAHAEMTAVIRNPQPGTNLISAECGIGKTRAALAVALERARKPYASESAEGLRAPPNSKTALTFPTHAIAIQAEALLNADGEATCRYFSPLSVVDDRGEPVCIYHDVARPLVAGGQSLVFQFCEGQGVRRCPHHAACSAREGYAGDPSARIHLGTHAKFREVTAAAGSRNLVVMDEAPSPIRTVRHGIAALTAAFIHLRAFEPDFAAAITPALIALATTVQRAEPGVAMTLEEAVASGSCSVGNELLAAAREAAGLDADADPVACAKAAIDAATPHVDEPDPDRDERAEQPRPPHPTPPMLYEAVVAARGDSTYAAQLGCASAVLRDILTSLHSDWPVLASVAVEGNARFLQLIGVDPVMQLIRDHEGPVVVMDANMNLRRPAFRYALGYDPPHHEFGAPDGAPIERTIQLRRGCTRAGWLPGRELRVNQHLVRVLENAIGWARASPGCTTLAVLTFLPLRLALEAAHGGISPQLERRWKSCGQAPKQLATVAADLAPIVAAWSGELLFGHYGALRGLDQFKHADALVTLGDPWGNLDDAKIQVAYLEDALDTTWEQWCEAQCAAELEQAHGRLRTIHRDRPGRALHIGTVLPSGDKWRAGRAAVQVDRGGRRERRPDTRDELEAIVSILGGVRGTARALQVAPQYVSRWQQGQRPIPAEELRLLRCLARQPAGGPLRWHWLDEPFQADAQADDVAVLNTARSTAVGGVIHNL